MQVIQVEFEGRNPMTSDFHGIRQLLHQLFLKSDINLSELADIVTGMFVHISCCKHVITVANFSNFIGVNESSSHAIACFN